MNNASSLYASSLNYISCDPEDYPGVLQAADVLRLVANSQQGTSIILYSTRADHCNTSSLREIAPANGIFTTLSPTDAQAALDVLRNHTNGMEASISPDRFSFTVSNGNQPGTGYSGSGSSNGSTSAPRPTTAVAMIILYTITGLITALFVVIIVTGAVRAHRHPERYGPNVAGRQRRSRAKGIARAMLDTIPIVKFGEKDETAAAKEIDIEMDATKIAQSPDKSKAATVEVAEQEKDTKSNAAASMNATNADGTDEAGQLGCSICTEDFNKGEEVRVLPCNHKFHPECVDPWLLNVSGTCPLCRIDLRPKGEQEETPDTDETPAPTTVRRTSVFDLIAPPLGHPPLMRPDRVNLASRRETVVNLQSAATGSREDRIAALRRYRQQRRNRGEQPETAEQAEERRSISTRLRERFRIRTRRQGEEEVATVEGESSNRRAPTAR